MGIVITTFIGFVVLVVVLGYTSSKCDALKDCEKKILFYEERV